MGGHDFTPAAGDVILKRGQWTTLFTWAGWSPLAFIIWDVEIQDNFREFPVQWIRYGAGLPPYWSGEFRGKTNFQIKPLVDLFIRVELKCELTDIGVNISKRTVGWAPFEK
jgi:hypothetical protein